jgi:hypothetical protein
MGKRKAELKVCVGNCGRGDNVEDLGMDERIVLK